MPKLPKTQLRQFPAGPFPPGKFQTPRPNFPGHLFGHRWLEVHERLRGAKQIHLFLDFDGTLVGFRPRPHQVRLGAAARKALAAVAAHKRVRAAIMSGRRRDDLAHYISIPGLELFGLYGWDRANQEMQIPAQTVSKLSEARKMLAELESDLPGIHIEDKGISLAVHFRGASLREQRSARSRVSLAMRQLAPELHLLRSSTTWEVAPRQIRGKGAALRELLGTVRAPYLPIYLGDDLTDEPAFEALRNGITVLVGPARKTAAGYRVGDYGEVVTFLERLAAAIE